MGCGNGSCGIKPDCGCDSCSHGAPQAAWGGWGGGWGFQPAKYPPVGANPYDETTGYSGGDLSLDKNALGPQGVSGASGSSTGAGNNSAAWGAVAAGLQALGQFGSTLSNNDVQRARIRAQEAAAAAGASDAQLAALGGLAPTYNTVAPGDTVRNQQSSSSSALPWIAAAAAALLLIGPKGFRL